MHKASFYSHLVILANTRKKDGDFEEIVLELQVNLDTPSQEQEMLDAHMDQILLQDKGKNKIEVLELSPKQINNDITKMDILEDLKRPH